MKGALALAGYILVAILTFRHETARIEADTSYSAMQRESAPLAGMMMGVCWPVYWPLRLSYLAFQVPQ